MDTLRARVLIKVPMELLLPAKSGREGKSLMAIIEAALIDYGIETLQVRFVGAGLSQLRELRLAEADEKDSWEVYDDTSTEEPF